ncbi:MAG TPA: group I intron-associated PD-(D/E)XK endonuclease [Terriglobales bacterium]|nr:group I intron-associated PD-(D/E)XK endonuclease [Terriglobales bacterium]
MFSTAKRQGEAAETLFLLRAVSLGLVVSQPWGDNARYDFIVDSGGLLSRVQVKSVSRPSPRNAYHLCVAAGSGSRFPYTPRDIDFLAAYIIPEDIWYLIPSPVLRAVHTISLHPAPTRQRPGRFEPFREAWHLLFSASG